MERRKFIQLGVAGITAGLIAPSAALAETVPPTATTADLYYTKDSQGRWNGKAATHLPNIEIGKTAGKITVNVVTAHEMKGYEHYIVKHVLLDKHYKFIAEKMFNPMEDKVAASSFSLDGYSGTLYALSMCNKHDVWLNSVEV